ncbi:hypothetical protein, partial [uncultured Allobaculum sp.]|uniref:hypothetical protein n=1 Tax=uncultured Allobaculum sp. TaxID=1187017 RepID=UPI00258529AF
SLAFFCWRRKTAFYLYRSSRYRASNKVRLIPLFFMLFSAQFFAPFSGFENGWNRMLRSWNF